jgi:hypothetical protein
MLVRVSVHERLAPDPGDRHRVLEPISRIGFGRNLQT